ncbi:MAG: HesB/IscA family protein [cyanobacterium endosymbiont of Rhopalodia musculus]|uniref:HesB/IscA family protein n=1 Tax=cyanobacterium endosymbiont of Epithemia clementina EcSB TaxID=3034674 RepID=UPI002480F4E9|nr:iron-sulfur cluster assembly accessory protein [cyanobacterium endosymbiont of Epithemia clementina EcSB]WGT67052.1 iron-sulfur cluster assembly accessory protein [cyanobacterium endosymbiont of Epithemia clementina EcSB]
MTVSLTEKAAFRLRPFLEGEEPKATGIRVGIKDGGCSGYEYTLNLVKQPDVQDIRFEQKNVPIYVDSQSFSLLEGVVIDFVDSLTQSGFTFTNPNAGDTCGCGKSFSSKDCGSKATPCS